MAVKVTKKVKYATGHYKCHILHGKFYTIFKKCTPFELCHPTILGTWLNKLHYSEAITIVENIQRQHKGVMICIYIPLILVTHFFCLSTFLIFFSLFLLASIPLASSGRLQCRLLTGLEITYTYIP